MVRSGAGIAARRHQLVAGGDDGDARPGCHRNFRVIHGGGERQVAGGNAPPSIEQDLALREVQALLAHILAKLDGGQGDLVAFGFGVLLRDHGVGAGGQQRAGENARGLAGLEAAVERAAGGGGADQLERRGLGEIGGARRVAVHGRQIGRRLGAAGRQRFGQHAAVRFTDRDFFRGQRHRAVEHALQRFSTGMRGEGSSCLTFRRCKSLSSRIQASRRFDPGPARAGS